MIRPERVPANQGNDLRERVGDAICENSCSVQAASTGQRLEHTTAGEETSL